MTGRDDVKSGPSTLGSADLGYLMADPYMEEDARILSMTCYFASDVDVEGPEEEMPLFGSVRNDYNWDQCVGNLEDAGSSCILVGPWSNPQFLACESSIQCLEDGEVMAGDEVPLCKMKGMDMSKDGGASSISHSDSEKASMAQRGAHRKKERSRRRLKHRKSVHGSAYSNSDIPPPHKLRRCRHICCKQ